MKTLDKAHSQASGAKIYKDGMDSFLAEAYAKLDELDFNNQLYIVEASTSIKNFNADLGKLFAQENIWGSGIEKPLMRITDVDCINACSMGSENQHLKISTSKIDFVIFDDLELVDTLKANKNYSLTAIGELDWSDWGETHKLQMVVKGYELEEKQTKEWNIYDF